MAGRTQQALYAEIDLELSWSEQALPQLERTKHVHALHPYLGKFVPQLVETFLGRCFTPGQRVYDPFAGSGTTLVEANAFGCEAVGCDISAFNCLLARVKTGSYALEGLEARLGGALATALADVPLATTAPPPTPWLQRWFAPQALAELLAYRVTLAGLAPEERAVGQIVLSRSARSARLVTHFDLDHPDAPVREPYWCHKHKRECRPVEEAGKFLRRYTADTVARLTAFAQLRRATRAEAIHADSRIVVLPAAVDGIVTSPPYPGLIDYHEQHRYAYELLGLDDRSSEEIGAAAQGVARQSLAAYSDGIVGAFANARRFMAPGSPVVIVVNDSRDLYPGILERAGLELESRVRRHVNRRTGRRAGEYFEDVLVCRSAAA